MREIIESLQYQMRTTGITLRLGERVEDISILPDGLVQATLHSGKHLHAETLLLLASEGRAQRRNWN